MDQKPIILFHTEELNFEKVKNEEAGTDTVIISGNAQPLNEDSRNGVRYRADSVKKAYKSLMSCPFLFSHDATRSLGHIIEVGLNDTHITYRADVDPEEKDYIRKVERGDIRHVSVGCMVENVEWSEEENMYICDVKEYVELSAVTTPGFANTSATKEGAIFLANALGDTEVLEKLKNAAEEKKEGDDEDEDEEKKEDAEEETPENDAESEEPKTEESEEEHDSTDPDEEPEESTEDAEVEDPEKPEETEEDVDEENPEDEGAESEEDTEEETPEENPEETSESLEKQEEGEVTTEEMVKTLNARVEELFSMNEELNNKVSALESKIESLEEKIDSQENLSEGTEEIEMAKDEGFTDPKAEVMEKLSKEGDAKKILEEAEKKKSELLDQSNASKKTEVINTKDVRMKNVSY